MVQSGQDGLDMFKATFNGRRTALTDAGLLSAALGVPLLPFKVMAAIHWQALKLWLRGARFYRMPRHGLYSDSDIGQRSR